MTRILTAVVILCGIGLMVGRAFEASQCMLLLGVLCMQMIQDMKD